MKRRQFAMSLLACAVCRSGQAADSAASSIPTRRLAGIDQFINTAVASNGIAGAVALVARDGHIVLLSAQGVMNVMSQQPMRTDSIFRIASMTKPVAAAAILMLVEEGKVRLEDPVSTYLPSYRGMKVGVARAPRPRVPQSDRPARPAYYAVAANREITVLDLLTHTSGLMSGEFGNAGGAAAYARRHETGLRWVDNLGRESVLEFQPGSRWSYSPFAGFDVVARVVELTSGQGFDTFLQTRLFDPLGMNDTFFWPTRARRERLVTVYNPGNGRLVANADPDSMSGARYFSGAGGLMSSAESYARFAMMLANEGELSGVRILSPSSVRRMRSSVITDALPGRRAGEGFGLGVRTIVDRVARRTRISNGSFGWSGAYGTHFWIDPSRRFVAMLMVQTPDQGRREEFETAVMQALG